MNKQLYGKLYQVPPDILNKITQTLSTLGNQYVDGVNRAKNILNRKMVSYSQLKTIIYDIQNMDKVQNKIKYELCGGDLMEKWATQFINSERNHVYNKKNMSKTSNEIGGIERKNPFLNKHKKSERKTNSTLQLIKTNSDSSVASRLTPKGLFEEIERIKKLMK